jgi:uncharacterized protein YaaQ
MMKLIVTIVDDRDVDQVTTAFTDQHIGVTRVSSTGNLLDPGNSVLLIGVDEKHVSRVMKVIAELAAPRQSVIPHFYAGSIAHTGLTEVQVGGFQSFVLNVDHFEQV